MRQPALTPDDEKAFREILGYLNFSGGKPDVKFQRNLNQLRASFGADRPWTEFQSFLREHLTRLQASVPAFADSAQAAAVIALVFDECLPAYRRFHADLLFHLSEEAFDQPFFIARMCEAVLEQGPPWNETARIVEGALHKLNDYVGFRPVAVLENGRQMQPYPHERFRPVPLYIKGAGVSVGPYHDLIEEAIRFFEQTPAEVLLESHFHLDQLDELALDVRAHDHTHPVNKRTNNMFGEWDPHVIDNSGRYRRFVVRKIILDALLSWMHEHQGELSREELLYDASAVLCGTILMASAISGSGPETHDSTVSLTSLLPKVARQRDTFYARLLEEAKGARAKRLHREAELTQQPFGHVRQYLNMQLAEYGARQVQHKELARLYARMGHEQAGQEEALEIPSVSARFECEMQWRLTATHLALDRGDVARAAELLREVEDFLHRGIECGALVDPWNILGFQAQFPLFSCREDSVPDQRIEILLDLMEQLFGAYSRALGEAAAQGLADASAELTARFERLADYWDQFATTAVEELPAVSGQESFESARCVAEALSQWRTAGESAGDISFWRQHVEQFKSAKAYALVVDALLERRDLVAAMGLLMQWLGQASLVGLESGSFSIHTLLMRWMKLACSPEVDPGGGPGHLWTTLRRLFDYLEANAAEFWAVPELSHFDGRAPARSGGLDEPAAEEPTDAFGFDADDGDDEQDLFEAAYDDVTYRDSADDGHFGETLDSGTESGGSEFELICRQIEPRLKFLNTLAELWQLAAVAVAANRLSAAGGAAASEQSAVVLQWLGETKRLQWGLEALLRDVWSRELDVDAGDHEANIEYDIQLQTKFYLLQTIVTTHVSCRMAEYCLLGILPPDAAVVGDSDAERRVIDVFRAIFRRDADETRRLLPELTRSISRQPLLYIPFDNGGQPVPVLRARTLQAVLRFLLTQLPRLGLLAETHGLLWTAYRMERTARPKGHAVTEFDRLFRTALKNSLELIVNSAAEWRSGKFPPRELVELVGGVVQPYMDLWLKHSSTMRLSHVETFKDPEDFEDIRDFISEYGADLFHARLLTLGNVRAVLHDGVKNFLDYLAETEDPLHPIKLLGDLEEGHIDEVDAVDFLEMIYGALVDKFDRFLEYNTTTTQSDYGELFYTFLDFLRTESAYDRNEWNLLPARVAHHVLAERGPQPAAELWEQLFANRTRRTAEQHLSELDDLEAMYGMRLPSIRDHLSEQFVKPLAVNRMVALVPKAAEDARLGRVPPENFERLRAEIDSYLESSFGSGIEVPEWIRQLEDALDQVDPTMRSSRYDAEPELDFPPVRLSLRTVQQVLKSWHEPQPASKSTPRKKITKRKPPSERKPESE